MDRHISFWLERTPPTDYARLESDLTVDVAVIGGGITGIMTAYILSQSGKTVALFEAARIAAGVTGHTTAKLTSLHTTIYHYLVQAFGWEKARMYAESQETAVRTVARLVDQHDIDCNFHRVDAYTYTRRGDQIEHLRREAEAAASLGLPATFVDRAPLPFLTRAAVRFTDQARFDPRRFLLPLAAAVEDAGGRIFEQTRAVAIEDTSHSRVRMENGRTVSAAQVVVATNIPIFLRGLYFARTRPNRGYAMALEHSGEINDAMYINAGRPTHSLRLSGGPEHLLIVSGEGHPVGAAEDHARHWLRLQDWATRDLEATASRYHWSTEDYYSVDRVPFIGRVGSSGRLFTATGFGGWGMTNGVVAAVLISDLILRGESPWTSLYDPGRVDRREVTGTLAKSVRDASHLVRDRLRPSANPAGIHEIGRGRGSIVEQGGKRIAVSRDLDGQLHGVSPTCTHLGCQVVWNDAERSWDCPCHGSRFSADGNVLHGPAVRPLAERGDLLKGDAPAA